MNSFSLRNDPFILNKTREVRRSSILLISSRDWHNG